MEPNTSEFLSDSLLGKLEDAEQACWTAYLDNIKQVPDNPFGVYISTLRRSTAFLMEASNSVFFNKTLGFSFEHTEYLQPLREFYHQRGKVCTLEILPFTDQQSLLLFLAKQGFYLSGWSAMLYKFLGRHEQQTRHEQEINQKQEFSSEIEIVHVDQEDSSILADIHVAGFEFHGKDKEREHLIVKAGYSSNDFKCFLAKKDGKNIGAGSLFIYNDIGIMFGGSTIPKFRGQGCQRALLRHRIQVATDLGCSFLISHTNLYTGSQRNLQRFGFSLACNRSRLTEFP